MNQFPIKSQSSNLNNIIWSFDKCGNIYFSLTDHPEKIFDININGKNEISCEKYVNLVNEVNEVNEVNKVNEVNEVDEDINENLDELCYTKGKLIIFDQTKTLRGTILKQKKLNKEEQNNDKDPNNEYDSDDEDIIKTTYYHEDNEFNEQIDYEDYGDDNDNDNDDTYNDYHYNPNSASAPMFSFSADDKTIKMKEIDKYIVDRDDCMALYDTLIYDGTPESCKLIFKSKLLNDSVIYRLCLYTSGDISFRPIGSNEVKYIIDVDIDNNIFIKKNTNNNSNLSLI